MTCIQIASSLKPPSVCPVSKSFQIRSRASPVFDRTSVSSLELISNGVGLRGGCLHDLHILRKQKPLRNAGVASAGLSAPQSVAGKWNAPISNYTISFTLNFSTNFVQHWIQESSCPIMLNALLPASSTKFWAYWFKEFYMLRLGRCCGDCEVGVYSLTRELGISSHSREYNLRSRCASVASRSLVVRLRLCVSSGTAHLESVRMARDLHRFCLLRPRKHRSHSFYCVSRTLKYKI